MKQIGYKYEFFLPFIAAVLFFFTRKVPLPDIIYTVFAILMAIWYFPLRLVLGDFLKKGDSKNSFVIISSSIISSLIVAISVVLLHNAESFFFKTTFQLLGILNVFLIYYFHFTSREARLFFSHLGLLFLTSVVFVG